MSDTGNYNHWQGVPPKAARGDGGAAILGRLRMDPIFDSGDRGPGTTRELSLILQRGTPTQQGREGGVTPYDGGGTRTRRDGWIPGVREEGDKSSYDWGGAS